MEPSVHIRREAFLTLLISAVETFKRECVGELFGYAPNKSKNYFLITNSIPTQCANRSYSEITPQTRSSKRVVNLISDYPYLFRKIGEYHSHPEWGNIRYGEEMSSTDIKKMVDGEYSLEIIIEISSRKKGAAPWTTEDDGSVKGSLKGYNFHVNVYTLDKKEEKPTPIKLKIVAPAALKALNRALGYKT